MFFLTSMVNTSNKEKHLKWLDQNQQLYLTRADVSQ